MENLAKVSRDRTPTPIRPDVVVQPPDPTRTLLRRIRRHDELIQMEGSPVFYALATAVTYRSLREQATAIEQAKLDVVRRRMAAIPDIELGLD